MNLDADVTSALKITAGQRSLTVAAVFVTTRNLCQTVTMTANTKIRKQLRKAITIFAILSQRHVKQTRFLTRTLYRQLGILRKSVII